MHEVLMLGISEGASCVDISCMFESIPWWIIREWIDKNCALDVALAYRARADILSDKADGVVAGSKSETLGVDKFQADHWMKQAARFDRPKYGDRTEVSVTNMHVVDIRGLLELREKRLLEIVVEGRVEEGVAGVEI